MKPMLIIIYWQFSEVIWGQNVSLLEKRQNNLACWCGQKGDWRKRLKPKKATKVVGVTVILTYLYRISIELN